MAEPFLAEIRLFSFDFPPRGWASCAGQLLPINQNQALFSLLGTTYGGDGRVNFALPNLAGRVPMHVGNNHQLGQRGGEETHTLQTAEMPAHTHGVGATSNNADQAYPPGNLWAAGGSQASFSSTTNASMDPQTVLPSGGNQPHENRSPFLVINYCIALQGIFPSRN